MFFKNQRFTPREVLGSKKYPKTIKQLSKYYQTTIIKILSVDGNGNWSEDVEYRHDPDQGILVNGEQNSFYSNTNNHLFEEDGVYELEVTDFTLCNLCPGSEGSLKLRKNMYELVAEFVLTSKINNNFKKTLEFKHEIFSMSQYSRTIGDDDESI